MYSDLHESPMIKVAVIGANGYVGVDLLGFLEFSSKVG